MDDRDRDWLTVQECARRMAVTDDQVVQMAKAGVLRVWPLAPGSFLVEPALVSWHGPPP